MELRIGPSQWYETIRFGDGVTLIHEPWIKPFYRCNIWHVRGRDRDLLFDSGLGHFSLRAHVPLVSESALISVANHAHFDHIDCHHEFVACSLHRAEADILADPRNDWTLAGRYATDQMFDALPEGWDAAGYQVKPAVAGLILDHGDVISLGDRAFEVVHTPGHSPGGIGLFERKTGIFLSGDIIYDGPLIDDAYHSDVTQYEETLRRLSALPVATVHGGHFPSFGPTRFRQLIDGYLAGRRKPGCHLV